jgi:hypothetical protein
MKHAQNEATIQIEVEIYATSVSNTQSLCKTEWRKNETKYVPTAG